MESDPPVTRHTINGQWTSSHPKHFFPSLWCPYSLKLRYLREMGRAADRKISFAELGEARMLRWRDALLTSSVNKPFPMAVCNLDQAGRRKYLKQYVLERHGTCRKPTGAVI